MGTLVQSDEVKPITAIQPQPDGSLLVTITKTRTMTVTLMPAEWSKTNAKGHVKALGQAALLKAINAVVKAANA